MIRAPFFYFIDTRLFRYFKKGYFSFFFLAMNPFGSELFVSLLAIGLNYAAIFKLPATSLLKDPVTTLWTTVPILFAGHLLLVILSNLLRGTSDKTLVKSNKKKGHKTDY